MYIQCLREGLFSLVEERVHIFTNEIHFPLKILAVFTTNQNILGCHREAVTKVTVTVLGFINWD